MMKEKEEHQILIVDDDEINAEMLFRRFTKRGFSVHKLHNGEDVLKYLDVYRPKIILLDILLPGLSGLEVLTEVRKKYSAVELSVVMITAKNETGDIVQALKLGANDFIQKPINIDIAVARLNTQLIAIKNLRDQLEKNELEAINTMIATYNHEINNPLTVAFGFIWKLKKENKIEYIEKIEESLNRIVQIVKQIDSMTSGLREKDKYAQQEKIYKMK